jgi:hypothetical protein
MKSQQHFTDCQELQQQRQQHGYSLEKLPASISEHPKF